MKIRLRSVFLITATAALVMAVVVNYLMPYQIQGQIPESILTKLDTRFDKLSPEMTRRQAFKTLGIDRYTAYYMGNGKRRGVYELKYQTYGSDYKVSMFKREDGAIEFGLKTPKREEWRDIVFTNAAGWKN